jgi:hypothetical protein
MLLPQHVALAGGSIDQYAAVRGYVACAQDEVEDETALHLLARKARFNNIFEWVFTQRALRQEAIALRYCVVVGRSFNRCC